MTQTRQSGMHAERIRDQAAQWSDLLRHRGGDPAIRASFETWRAQDPAHASAFARLDAAHRNARSARGSAGMAEMMQNTKARIAARRARQRRYRHMALAASVVVAVIAGLGIAGTPSGGLGALPAHARHALAGERLYLTAVGERRKVVLRDGSSVTLNTDSRMVVRQDAQRRDVALLKGQALFEVARDQTRPFVVTAGRRTVTALGTAFDVRVSADRLAVTLIEGKVAVAEQISDLNSLAPSGGQSQGESTAPGSTVLAPGDQLVIATAPAAVPQVHKADIERAVSWREGHLIFHSDRLEHVIAEINRYRSQPLLLADQRLGDLRVSGVVNTANTAVFVETMTTYYPLQVVGETRDGVMLGPRG